MVAIMARIPETTPPIISPMKLSPPEIYKKKKIYISVNFKQAAYPMVSRFINPETTAFL